MDGYDWRLQLRDRPGVTGNPCDSLVSKVAERYPVWCRRLAIGLTSTALAGTACDMRQ
jgi:hypothetical protein